MEGKGPFISWNFFSTREKGWKSLLVTRRDVSSTWQNSRCAVCLSLSSCDEMITFWRRYRNGMSGMDVKCEKDSLWSRCVHHFDDFSPLSHFLLFAILKSFPPLTKEDRKRESTWVVLWVWSILWSECNFMWACQMMRMGDPRHLHNVMFQREWKERPERVDHEKWWQESACLQCLPSLSLSHLDEVYCSLILYRFKNQSIFKMKRVESRGVKGEWERMNGMKGRMYQMEKGKEWKWFPGWKKEPICLQKFVEFESK